MFSKDSVEYSNDVDGYLLAEYLVLNVTLRCS